MKSLATVVALAALAFGTVARANDVDPFGFEKEHFVSSKARAEVAGDLRAARAAGELPVFGEIGVRLADAPSTRSRAQVAAETREAQRLGLVSYGELGARQATAEEERQIRVAGMQALERAATAHRNAPHIGG